MKKDIITHGVAILLGILTITAIGFALMKGMDKQAVADCQKLVDQSIEFQNAGFYITEYEDAKCRHHGIAIDAPVMKR